MKNVSAIMFLFSMTCFFRKKDCAARRSRMNIVCIGNRIRNSRTSGKSTELTGVKNGLSGIHENLFMSMVWNTGYIRLGANGQKVSGFCRLSEKTVSGLSAGIYGAVCDARRQVCLADCLPDRVEDIFASAIGVARQKRASGPFR